MQNLPEGTEAEYNFYNWGKKKKKRINKKKSNDLSGGKNCLLKTA